MTGCFFPVSTYRSIAFRLPEEKVNKNWARFLRNSKTWFTFAPANKKHGGIAQLVRAHDS